MKVNTFRGPAAIDDDDDDEELRLLETQDATPATSVTQKSGVDFKKPKKR